MKSTLTRAKNDVIGSRRSELIILSDLVPQFYQGRVSCSIAVTCQTLRRLRRAILPSGVVLIHDSSRPHNAVVTQQLLEEFKWDLSDHPAYSPDLATSDFHLFPELENWLEGSRKMGLNVALNLTSLAATFFEVRI
ncbi:hypothetical protein AVEN_147028-1 [Araneus ventricosus]|uniref:Histone-lysine N-methyltransferase SETMAR n=1 Tax=Araneus ventricosus TaxID=182803 RepID=A0A4Y2NI69_ARAVE|nr:hypothetical protein AVEN_147028-1 [Araneus ventricosus]